MKHEIKVNLLSHKSESALETVRLLAVAEAYEDAALIMTKKAQQIRHLLNQYSEGWRDAIESLGYDRPEY